MEQQQEQQQSFPSSEHAGQFVPCERVWVSDKSTWYEIHRYTYPSAVAGSEYLVESIRHQKNLEGIVPVFRCSIYRKRNMQ